MVDNEGPEADRESVPFPHVLRAHQVDAIRAVEDAVRGGSRHVVVSMVTGSGQTLTAVALIDRLLASGYATKVLYLVDRTMQAHQIEDVIRSVSSSGGYEFTDMYQVYGQRDGLNRVIQREPGLPDRYLCVGTWSQLRSAVTITAGQMPFADMLATVPDVLFDLVVAEKSGRQPDSATAEMPVVVGHHFHAKVIEFTPTDANIQPQHGVLAFKYTIEDALRDGSALTSWPSLPHYTFPASTDVWPLHRRVFLYCTEVDRVDAAGIQRELHEAGLQSVLVSQSENDSMDEILQQIHAGDSLVYLLSPDSIGNPWLDIGLKKILTRRGAELVPALLRECLVPMTLVGQAIVDVRRDAGELINNLKWADSINLSELDARRFEKLVVDLLPRIGFSIEPLSADADAGFDLQAVYRDRPGFGEPTQYLIQLTAASNAPPTVRGLRQLVDQLPSLAPRHALLVTSGQLTSVAESTLSGSGELRTRLHILDGPRLVDLLLEQPDLIVKYFIGQANGYV